jgi:N-acetylglutamate synthase-like GNAT family acetyltransferase
MEQPRRMHPESVRQATIEDIPALKRLIGESARGLAAADYTREQIEGALDSAWGVDTQLIKDATYFVIERAGVLAACGGWSRRKTLFGGDAQPGREPGPLNPAEDAARIRAFFVHPSCARQGLGRMLLHYCENEARSDGFTRAELVATLPGERLYRAFGYSAIERTEYPLPNGQTILFIRMRKEAL